MYVRGLGLARARAIGLGLGIISTAQLGAHKVGEFSFKSRTLNS